MIEQNKESRINVEEILRSESKEEMHEEKGNSSEMKQIIGKKRKEFAMIEQRFDV